MADTILRGKAGEVVSVKSKRGVLLRKLAGGIVGVTLASGTLCGAETSDILFRVTFDDTAEAQVAKGVASPVAAKGLEFVEGIAGRAVRFSQKAKSVLAYAEAGNLDHRRGTVALWIKSEMPKSVKPEGFRFLLANKRPADRIGSGELGFWINGNRLRCDVSDDRDSYIETEGAILFDGAWHHVAWTWDEVEMRMYVDGRRVGSVSDGHSPMRQALRGGVAYRFSKCQSFKEFFVGSRNGVQQWDGLIDELSIWSGPLLADEIRRLADAYGRRPDGRPDYAALYADAGANPYVGPATDRAGEFAPDDLELLEEVRLGSAEDVSRLRAAKRFNSVGVLAYGELDGKPYLEADAKKGGRFAVRFELPRQRDAFYVFDIDYPDDKVRTADLIFQSPKRKAGNYAMQCGVATGDEYANTGRVLTHRTIWWAQPEDPILVAMTARENAPAAVASIRLYRVRSRRLPVPRLNLPKPDKDGWRRQVALYYEDPAVGKDFAVPEEVSTPEALGATIDRTIALMKFTGENLFAYPGAWYQGLIGEAYNPRNHARDFLSGWYEKFDREEDLSVMPTLNVNNMPVPKRLVTLETMTNGALHASPIAIHDTGKPNWGRWHDTPPNFNIHHQAVRAHIEQIVDTLIEQGKGHPSFKGVCLHLTRHCMLWFGDEASGYNDYTVRAFADDCAVAVPFDRFAANPLRGKDYAEWLRANAWEKWLQWRCDLVTDFYVKIAKKLSSARPDLKLWINSFVPADFRHPEFMRPDYMSRANRRCGLDGAAITKGAANVVLCQTLVPADYRWRGKDAFPTPVAFQHQRVLETLPGFYDLLKGADFPWVNQHDRYWESAIGTGRKHWSTGAAGATLACEWMEECPWRVSTINPSGFHALRHFILPLRYHDVLGVSKGGFLVGTYGMEPYLAKFASEFRSLPAVKMSEFFREGNVVARKAPFAERTYGYVVNTGDEPMRVTVPGYGAFALGPYEFKAFEVR